MEQKVKNNTITLAEQREQGLIRPAAQRFVPAGPVQRDLPTMPINSQIAHVIDAAPVATQHVEMRTSAVDRALGFTIASLPLFGGFALVVLLCCVYFANVPFLSLPALLIFWLSFVAAWVIGYAYTLSISAEGVSQYEATQKWDVIKIEQRQRWRHYDRQVGIEPTQANQSNGLLIVVFLAGLVLAWVAWGNN